MTDGLMGQESGPGPVETYAEAIANPAIYEPGEVFVYRPAPWQVFGEWVRRKVAPDHGDAVEYIQARIFDHLNIAPESWPLEADGYPRMPSSSVWTARQWAVFAEFVRLGGNWNGEQLVDEATLAANFVGTEANPAYGLGWWLAVETGDNLTEEIGQDRQEFLNNYARDPALPDVMYIARGGGNQRIYVIPEWEMFILRQQRVDGERGSNFTDQDLWNALLNQ